MTKTTLPIEHKKLLLNGDMVGGEGDAETIYNPATGDVIATIPEASFEQLEKAIRAASAAFP